MPTISMRLTALERRQRSYLPPKLPPLSESDRKRWAEIVPQLRERPDGSLDLSVLDDDTLIDMERIVGCLEVESDEPNEHDEHDEPAITT